MQYVSRLWGESGEWKRGERRGLSLKGLLYKQRRESDENERLKGRWVIQVSLRLTRCLLV